MSMAVRKRLDKNNVLILILLIWGIYLLTFGLLQFFGAPVGFKVWPLGEDRNWLGFMMSAKGPAMAHIFWSIDNRNPLQPWWWLLISPLLHYSDYALYLVRKLLDPLLAIATFLLIDQLHHQRSRLFAFCVALIVLLWNFNGYFEQITWNALLALFFTLMAIYSYCRYIDEQRKSGFFLALGLICYFIALATYTLQSGALIAVAAIAFFRHQSMINFSSRFSSGIRDVALFFAVFVIYNLIWYTASSLGDTYFSFDFSVFAKQFLNSINKFFYHGIYDIFWLYVKQDWSLRTIILTFTATFAVVFACLKAFTNKINGSVEFHTGWSFAVLAAIATPTIILESTSAVWIPGTRSLMLQQVWQPLLYVGIIFLICNKIPLLPIKIKQALIITSVSFLAGIVMLFGMTYNHRLVVRTHYQAMLAEAINQLHIPKDVSPRFLIKIVDPTQANVDLWSIPPNIYYYGPTLLHRKNAFIRLFTNQELLNMPASPFWKIEFGSKKAGVLNATPINNTAMLGQPEAIPYKDVWIIFFDGKQVIIPPKVYEDDFKNLQVVWKRKTPIDQTKNHQEV